MARNTRTDARRQAVNRSLPTPLACWSCGERLRRWEGMREPGDGRLFEQRLPVEADQAAGERGRAGDGDLLAQDHSDGHFENVPATRDPDPGRLATRGPMSLSFAK